VGEAFVVGEKVGGEVVVVGEDGAGPYTASSFTVVPHLQQLFAPHAYAAPPLTSRRDLDDHLISILTYLADTAGTTSNGRTGLGGLES